MYKTSAVSFIFALYLFCEYEEKARLYLAGSPSQAKDGAIIAGLPQSPSDVQTSGCDDHISASSSP